KTLIVENFINIHTKEHRSNTLQYRMDAISGQV
ncbi:MAG: hypothetical protein Greene101415_1036, partial [Parcubacteria group bacterium Greene1014_15]